jgi:hypothetical protein
LLKRLHTNKTELLMVLDRPEIPLQTNGSENDIRCQVTRRKVSAGTRSKAGRDCRDTFLGLAKTCSKQGVAFWHYLGSRLGVPGQPLIPRCRNSSAAAVNPLKPRSARAFAPVTLLRNTGKTPGDALSSDVGGGMTTAPPQSESELSHASGECGADELCRFPVMDFSDSPSVCRPHPTSIR